MFEGYCGHNWTPAFTQRGKPDCKLHLVVYDGLVVHELLAPSVHPMMENPGLWQRERIRKQADGQRMLLQPSIMAILCRCYHPPCTFTVLLLHCPVKCPQISTHSVFCALSLRLVPFHTRARSGENPVPCPLLAVNNGHIAFPKWQGIGLNMLRCVGTAGLRAYLLQIKTDVDAQINSCSCFASFQGFVPPKWQMYIAGPYKRSVYFWSFSLPSLFLSPWLTVNTWQWF